MSLTVILFGVVVLVLAVWLLSLLTDPTKIDGEAEIAAEKEARAKRRWWRMRR